MIARQKDRSSQLAARGSRLAARGSRQRGQELMRIRNWGATVLFVTLVAAYFAAYARAQAQADAKAATVLADMRKALGGEQKIAALKGLSLRADYRREMSAGPMGGGAAGGGG